jgi:hypothetical protein
LDKSACYKLAAGGEFVSLTSGEKESVTQLVSRPIIDATS